MNYRALKTSTAFVLIFGFTFQTLSAFGARPPRSPEPAGTGSDRTSSDKDSKESSPSTGEGSVPRTPRSSPGPAACPTAFMPSPPPRAVGRLPSAVEAQLLRSMGSEASEVAAALAAGGTAEEGSPAGRPLSAAPSTSTEGRRGGPPPTPGSGVRQRHSRLTPAQRDAAAGALVQFASFANTLADDATIGGAALTPVRRALFDGLNPALGALAEMGDRAAGGGAGADTETASVQFITEYLRAPTPCDPPAYGAWRSELLRLARNLQGHASDAGGRFFDFGHRTLHNPRAARLIELIHWVTPLITTLVQMGIIANGGSLTDKTNLTVLSIAAAVYMLGTIFILFKIYDPLPPSRYHSRVPSGGGGGDIRDDEP